MSLLVTIGSLVTILGLGGLFYCILQGFTLRKQNLPDAELTARLRGLIPVHLAALCCAALGLMMVVIGLVL